MRAARVDDMWRALRRRHSSILNVEWRGYAKLPDSLLQIARPITLICGENGAGKSTLLRVISQALNGYPEKSEGDGEIVRISCEFKNGKATTAVEAGEVAEFFSGDEGSPEVVSIENGKEAASVVAYINEEPNFDDFLNEVDFRELNHTELSIASYVVGRNYARIWVAEIEDSTYGKVFPYFKVEFNNAEYVVSGMGDGEYAALHLLWRLSRVSANSVVLLEEPEAFLTPKAQEGILNFIAELAVVKNLTVVITSHSGAIAGRFALDEIIYATRATGAVVLRSPASNADLIERLGLAASKALLFLVEDQAAEIFARTLVDDASPQLGRRGEYLRCGGESGVRRGIAAIPDFTTKVAHIGLLDGDMRASSESEDRRTVFLPGESAPERLLETVIKSLSVAELAELLSASEVDIASGLQQSAGIDMHDWFRLFSRRIGVSYEEVLRRLTRRWASANEAAVTGFLAAVVAVVEGSGSGGG